MIIPGHTNKTQNISTNDNILLNKRMLLQPVFTLLSQFFGPLGCLDCECLPPDLSSIPMTDIFSGVRTQITNEYEQARENTDYNHPRTSAKFVKMCIRDSIKNNYFKRRNSKLINYH